MSLKSDVYKITYGDMNTILGSTGSTNYSGTGFTSHHEVTLNATNMATSHNFGKKTVISNIPLNKYKQLYVSWTMQADLYGYCKASNAQYFRNASSTTLRFYLYYSGAYHEINTVSSQDLYTNYMRYNNPTGSGNTVFEGSFYDNSITSATNVTCSLAVEDYMEGTSNPHVENGYITFGYTASTNCSASVTQEAITGVTLKQCVTYLKVKNSGLSSGLYLLYNSGNTAYNNRLVAYGDFYRNQIISATTNNVNFGYNSGSTSYIVLTTSYTQDRVAINSSCITSKPSWVSFQSYNSSNRRMTFITNSVNTGYSARSGTIVIKPKDCASSFSVSATQTYGYQATFGGVSNVSGLMYINGSPGPNVNNLVIVYNTSNYSYCDFYCDFNYDPNIPLTSSLRIAGRTISGGQYYFNLAPYQTTSPYTNAGRAWFQIPTYTLASVPGFMSSSGCVLSLYFGSNPSYPEQRMLYGDFTIINSAYY